MGNGYNQHLRHQDLHRHYRNTFLPMLCSRPSIKDVSLPRWEDLSASSSHDPLSPKISCMGQVKRTNKIIGFPTNTHKLGSNTTKSNPNTVKNHKLKRFFSGKNLTTTTTTGAVASSSCRRREVMRNRDSGSKVHDGNVKGNYSAPINIVDLDPPLPVIKKAPKQEDKAEADTLWKRRSGGVALRSLQLQPVQLNRHLLEPSTA